MWILGACPHHTQECTPATREELRRLFILASHADPSSRQWAGVRCRGDEFVCRPSETPPLWDTRAVPEVASASLVWLLAAASAAVWPLARCVAPGPLKSCHTPCNLNAPVRHSEELRLLVHQALIRNAEDSNKPVWAISPLTNQRASQSTRIVVPQLGNPHQREGQNARNQTTQTKNTTTEGTREHAPKETRTKPKA